jgi:putative membrane protein
MKPETGTAECVDDSAGRTRFALGLGALFAVQVVLLAIRPTDRGDWALENAIALPFAAMLLWTSRVNPLSRSSYALIFGFLALHEVGSHYTYSIVPYDDWVEMLTGRTLSALVGWERNHYDRLVHLAFGLLLAVPMREVLSRHVRARPGLIDALALAVMVALSSAYELLEWLAAIIVDPELGIAFVGAQGDTWDAQKDASLAAAGAMSSLAIAALLRGRGRASEAAA